MSESFLCRGGLAVVDSGKSGNWTWYKLSNGVAVCFGKFDFDVTLSETWGSCYSSAEKPGAFVYPVDLFIETPVSLMSLNYSDYNCWIATISAATKDHTQGVQFVRPTPVAESQGQIFNLSVGRWKT